LLPTTPPSPQERQVALSHRDAVQRRAAKLHRRRLLVPRAAFLLILLGLAVGLPLAINAAKSGPAIAALGSTTATSGAVTSTAPPRCATTTTHPPYLGYPSALATTLPPGTGTTIPGSTNPTDTTIPGTTNPTDTTIPATTNPTETAIPPPTGYTIPPTIIPGTTNTSIPHTTTTECVATSTAPSFTTTTVP